MSQINQNGTFRFNTDLPFDAANPRTYPERLTIRIPSLRRDDDQPQRRGLRAGQVADGRQQHAQPRPALRPGALPATSTPGTTRCSRPARRPRSTRTTSRRASASPVSSTTSGKSLVRAGYGIFYNRTMLGAIDDTHRVPEVHARRSSPASRTTTPIRARAAAQFPTDPFLVNGPVVNRALLDQLYPPGSVLRNTGVVIYDTPDRRQPYAHQMTVGYVRELASSLAIHADYVRIMNRDMFLSRNLLPLVARRHHPHRRHHPRRRLRPLRCRRGQLQAAGVGVREHRRVRLRRPQPAAREALRQPLVGRVSYSLSKSRGTATDQADRNTDQFLHRPAPRRARWADAGRSAARPVDGQPRRGAQDLRHDPGGDLALHDRLAVHHLQQQRRRRSERRSSTTRCPPAPTAASATNALKDVEDAGGRNGAYGPDYFQLDLRAGWRKRIQERTIEAVRRRLQPDQPDQLRQPDAWRPPTSGRRPPSWS